MVCFVVCNIGLWFSIWFCALSFVLSCRLVVGFGLCRFGWFGCLWLFVVFDMFVLLDLLVFEFRWFRQFRWFCLFVLRLYLVLWVLWFFELALLLRVRLCWCLDCLIGI